MPPRKAPGEAVKHDLVLGKDFNQECRPVHFHRLPDTCKCKPCSCGNKKPLKPVSESSAQWNAVFGKSVYKQPIQKPQQGSAADVKAEAALAPASAAAAADEKSKRKLYCASRPAKPATLTKEQIDWQTVSMDIAETGEGIRLVEIIRLPRINFDCSHHSYECMKGSVFYCASCGLMAETIKHDWGEDVDETEKYNTDQPRHEKMLADFLKKPIDPKM